MRSRLIVRPRFLRRPLVVLQVAESKPYNYDPTVDIAPSGYCEVWRDARPEDVAIVREEKENSDA
jgi:hypothetical protein